MQATLSQYRQSPRKVRLVATLLKGMTVKNALVQSDALTKRASLPLRKLLLSAVANAKQKGIADTDSLVIREFRVDKAVIAKRWMPRAMGRATPIHKRSSRVLLVLGEKIMKQKDVKKEAKKAAFAEKRAAKTKTVKEVKESKE